MDDYKPLTSEELNRGYFFLTHKVLIKKIVLALVAFVVLLLYVFLVVQFVKFFQGASMEKLAVQISQDYDWSTHHQLRAPQALEVTGTQIMSLGDRTYNLIAFVSNSNDDWAVKEAQYRFVVNGQPLDTEYTFFNPDESRIVVNSAYQSAESVRDLSIDFGNIAWQRTDNDYQNINWQISDVEFTPATRQTEGERTFDVPARVTWQAQNMSLYNFWEVGWQVILQNNDQLVGIQEIVSKDFLSLETRDMEAVWLSSLPRVTKAQVFPVVNNLDKDNYKTLEADNFRGL